MSGQTHALKPNFSNVNQSLVFSGNNILLQGNNLNLDNQDNISLILVFQPQIQNHFATTKNHINQPITPHYFPCTNQITQTPGPTKTNNRLKQKSNFKITK